jgi:hypothetical protein
MPEQQWEYCQLSSSESKGHAKGLFGGGKEGASYSCSVNFFSPNGGIFYKLSDIETIMAFNPFEKALSLLGINGWELVSIQFGNYIDPNATVTYNRSGVIRWDNKVAYLKRPVLQGRKVDEPKLVL